MKKSLVQTHDNTEFHPENSRRSLLPNDLEFVQLPPISLLRNDARRYEPRLAVLEDNSTDPYDTNNDRVYDHCPSVGHESNLSNDVGRKLVNKNNRKSPTPRSTVHTVYTPMTRPSDSLLDPNGVTIQLLRFAVLLYAPLLMPALNSLIARQNSQVITIPYYEGSNDFLMQVFRMLNDQRYLPNLPYMTISPSDRTSFVANSISNVEHVNRDTMIPTDVNELFRDNCQDLHELPIKRDAEKRMITVATNTAWAAWGYGYVDAYWLDRANVGRKEKTKEY